MASAENVPTLAFDLSGILAKAAERLRDRIRWQAVGFELLLKKIAFSQFQAIYAAILGRDLDKRNFRKKLLALFVSSLFSLESWFFTWIGTRLGQ